jgi:ABC-2 type transport system ATP-binding protein
MGAAGNVGRVGGLAVALGIGAAVMYSAGDTTGLVLGNQVTPVPVTLDGQTHTITIPLEQVAHTLAPGETVTLQLVASAADYETIWSVGEVNVSSMQLTLPTADAAAISPEAIA